MVETELLIRNQFGLHVRAASKFVRIASKFKCEVLVSLDGIEVNGKSILGVMMLAAEMGSTIKVKTVGTDEQEALNAIQALVDGKFEGEP